MEEEETELRNPFPSPPSHYTNYTTHNLKLLELLRERARNENLEPGVLNQHEILSDQADVPAWPLTQLEKPRVDWILEEGHYTVFGDMWFVKETIPSLAELGGHQLHPADPNRRPALLSILRSLLVTYSNLTGAILAPPPPPYSTVPPEWHRHVEWITVLAQNLMAAANDLRPVQARGHLESMMQRQLELRREETQAIHAKCDTLEARLSELRAAGLELASPRNAGSDVGEQRRVGSMSVFFHSHLHLISLKSTQPVVTIEDALRWAEEVT
ncbi:MED7 protein-domain-containing protein [Melanogaster broomeanus]|nr:MED7 protein-domain-containing protein [Melanogaster broomeanus]